MDFFAWLGGSAGWVLGYLIPFVVVLSVVVFVHELGHFWVARRFGTKVETFSIGFGREIAGWTDRNGIRWKIGWLPLGGYVRFWGDDNPASVSNTDRLQAIANDPRRAECFHYKPLYQRALIVAAGPLANFILAIAVFAGMFMFMGERLVSPIVDEVRVDSAAAEAGIRSGDVIVAIDGRTIRSFGDMQRIVGSSAGEQLDVTIRRDGQEVTVQATPQMQELQDRFGNTHRLGILGVTRNTEGEGVEQTVYYGPASAIGKGIAETLFVIDRTLNYLGRMIMGVEDASQLSGPLGIAKLSGDVASVSLIALINLVAVLSISIGLINLFPIPMLDGGHLLYYAYEGIRGRPLGVEAQEFGFRIGLAFVLGLMLFATWNDLVKFQIF